MSLLLYLVLLSCILGCDFLDMISHVWHSLVSETRFEEQKSLKIKLRLDMK